MLQNSTFLIYFFDKWIPIGLKMYNLFYEMDKIKDCYLCFM